MAVVIAGKAAKKLEASQSRNHTAGIESVCGELRLKDRRLCKGFNSSNLKNFRELSGLKSQGTETPHIQELLTLVQYKAMEFRHSSSVEELKHLTL